MTENPPTLQLPSPPFRPDEPEKIAIKTTENEKGKRGERVPRGFLICIALPHIDRMQRMKSYKR